MQCQDLLADVSGSRELSDMLDPVRCCVRCDSLYTERDNIGRWRCTAYHPLSNFATLHDETYACCDRPRDAPGCVPADHTDSVLVDIAPKLLTRQKAALLDITRMVQRKSWQLVDGYAYLVHRIDPTAYCAAVDVNRSDTLCKYDPLRAYPRDRRIL